MAQSLSHVRVLACVTFATLLASGCKFGQQQSAVREGETDASTSTIHGTPVTVAQENEILLALGLPAKSTVDPLGTDPLGPKSETQIATNDGSGSTVEGYALQGDAYVERCRAAGVPIPPPWGDAKWKQVNQLTSGRIFALDPNLTTILYSYQDPNVKGGVCAALPRLDGGRIVALGIICQSASGQACFWDNKERAVSTGAGGQRFQATISDGSRIRPELVANGDNLLENCSGCHRGSNVFILHHDALQELPDSGATDTYEPISNQGWKNVTLDSSNVPQCATCHDDANKLGKLDVTYCGTVMMPSIQSARWDYDPTTRRWTKVDLHAGGQPPMPPADQVADVSEFAADVAYIKSECKKAYAAARSVFPFEQPSP